MQDIFEQARVDVVLGNVKDFYLKRKKLCKKITTMVLVAGGALLWWRYERAEQIETSSVQFLRAVQYVEMGNLDKGMHALDHMPSKYTTSYTLFSQFLAADVLVRKRDVERAISVYESLMKTDDPVYQALAAVKYLYLAALTMEEGQAHAALDTWINKAPQWADVLLELKAAVYAQHNRIEEAMRVYDSLLEKTLPEDTKVRIQLARLACVRKR